MRQVWGMGDDIGASYGVGRAFAVKFGPLSGTLGVTGGEGEGREVERRWKGECMDGVCGCEEEVWRVCSGMVGLVERD